MAAQIKEVSLLGRKTNEIFRVVFVFGSIRASVESAHNHPTTTSKP